MLIQVDSIMGMHRITHCASLQKKNRAGLPKNFLENGLIPVKDMEPAVIFLPRTGKIRPRTGPLTRTTCPPIKGMTMRPGISREDKMIKEIFGFLQIRAYRGLTQKLSLFRITMSMMVYRIMNFGLF